MQYFASGLHRLSLTDTGVDGRPQIEAETEIHHQQLQDDLSVASATVEAQAADIADLQRRLDDALSANAAIDEELEETTWREDALRQYVEVLFSQLTSTEQKAQRWQSPETLRKLGYIVGCSLLLYFGAILLCGVAGLIAVTVAVSVSANMLICMRSISPQYWQNWKDWLLAPDSGKVGHLHRHASRTLSPTLVHEDDLADQLLQLRMANPAVSIHELIENLRQCDGDINTVIADLVHKK